MYKIVRLQHTVQIPPSKFGTDIEEAAFDILSMQHNGQLDDIGFVILVTDIIEVQNGRILSGSPATHHPVIFEVLVYEPIMNEIVEGLVVELVEYGAFIRLGPTDALVHVSQIANDYFKFENISQLLTGKDTLLKMGLNDNVRGRIIAVNMAAGGKLGLTLRNKYLGKIEWIQSAIKRAMSGEDDGGASGDYDDDDILDDDDDFDSE